MGVLQEVCAKVWELCVKAELSITERMLPDFGKQDSVRHFLFILADAENSGCRSHVLTSLFFFFGKKKCWLWFALKGNRIKGNRGNVGKVLLTQEMAV